MLTGLVEAAAVLHLGIRFDELSLDEKSEIIFVEQGYAKSSFRLLPLYFYKFYDNCEAASTFWFWFVIVKNIKVMWTFYIYSLITG